MTVNDWRMAVHVAVRLALWIVRMTMRPGLATWLIGRRFSILVPPQAQQCRVGRLFSLAETVKTTKPRALSAGFRSQTPALRWASGPSLVFERTL
jgi:hypothetical protein